MCHGKCISHFHVLLDHYKGYKRGVIVPNCSNSENFHDLQRVWWPRVMSWGHDAMMLYAAHTHLRQNLFEFPAPNLSCSSSYRLCWVADWSHFLTYYHSNWFSPSVNSFLMGPISYILSSHSPRHQSLINKHSNQKPRQTQETKKVFIHSINDNLVSIVELYIRSRSTYPKL